ncbi:MAG: hypothetical protein LBK61_13435 [Spirochaetaceae bacterium]|nr:hypothetical protein [Spirochaetaceae bacterium]
MIKHKETVGNRNINDMSEIQRDWIPFVPITGKKGFDILANEEGISVLTYIKSDKVIKEEQKGGIYAV